MYGTLLQKFAQVITPQNKTYKSATYTSLRNSAGVAQLVRAPS